MYSTPDTIFTSISDIMNLEFLVSILITYLVLKLAFKIIKKYIKNKIYDGYRCEFLQEREQDIIKFLTECKNKVPESKKLEIINSNATQLLQKLQKFEITSEEILISYGLRAATIGLNYGLIADTNFMEALNEAQEMDRIRKTGATNLPELFGLPLSVKDHITTKGFRTTAGFSHALKEKKCSHDCNFIKALRKKGAIFFVSSNIPQGLATIESVNKIFGRACNPWNNLRSCGGSSGGEAGLISAQCSPLGIGSDAAGSIRIPSSFCGIYGFSPSPHRISLKRTINLRKYDLHVSREIGCTYGPMGRCVEDLALIMRNIFGNQLEDNDCSPILFDEKVYSQKKRLRIGYFLDFETCEVFPANRKVILEVVSKLKSCGHDVVEIKDTWTERFFYTGVSIMLAHGMGVNFSRTLDDEYFEKPYRLQVLLSLFPEPIRIFFGYMSKVVGQERMGKILKTVVKKDLNSFYDLIFSKEKLKEAFVDDWNKQQLDILINPVLPFPAIRHGDSEILAAFVGSTFLYNVVGMPSGVVPIRKIHENEQYYEPTANDIATYFLKNVAKNSAGLPIGVQVASMTFQDELCLNVMKEIEDLFEFHELPMQQNIN